MIFLEEARKNKVIASGLEAKVVLNGGHADANLWQQYRDSLPALFIVSQIDFGKPGPALLSDVCLGIQRADGKKCERCWNYSVHVGENAAHPTICERCTAALEEINRAAAAS